MKRESGRLFDLFACACGVVVLAGLLCVAGAQESQRTNKHVQPQNNSGAGQASQIARGKYLVNNVAMCGQCHTPRDSNGALDQSRALDGAPVFLQPAAPNLDWPLKAPRIGGNPPANDDDMVKLLTTGIWIDGKPLRFPMMPFRMSDSDARAVVAYLKSLNPQR